MRDLRDGLVALSLCWLMVLFMGCVEKKKAADGSSAGRCYYVATNGRDTWSGRLAEPNAAKTDGPFATLLRARDAIRALKIQNPKSKIQNGAAVFVRGGTYFLCETFGVGPGDSGTAQCPITYAAYEDEKPVLIGGKEITGFKPYKGKILQAQPAKCGLGDVYFRQLFFKGKRQILARWPNLDPSDPHGGEWAYVEAVEGKDCKHEFMYAEDVKDNWKNPTEGEVGIFPGHDWSWNILPIANVDREARKITFKRKASYGLATGDRYFLQNLFEELDSPGEWYLDKESGTLYFWPPEEISSGQVVAPMVDTVVSLENVEGVIFKGFTIECCDGSAVVLKDCHNCLIAKNVVRNCGATGIAVAGGTGNGAVGNDVYETGMAGISISGGDRKTLTPGGNYATNNYIHHTAAIHRTYKPGVSCAGVGNVVSHNLIHDIPHAGLTLSGNDNVIEFNHVHHVNLQSADTGGIYFCSRDWTQRGNVIRYNIFHHVGGFGKAFVRSRQRGKLEFRYPHFTWGIYLDDPTTGTLVYGNFLYAVPICALHNHGGRDNTFENNIIIDCPALGAGMLSPHWECWPDIHKKLNEARYPGSPYLEKYPEISKIADTRPEEMSGVKFVRNIVYYTKDGTEFLRDREKDIWGENRELLYRLRMTQEDFAKNVWDYNTIYCPEDLSLVISLDCKPEPHRMLCWDEWKKTGADAHSVLADPLFVNAANGDYRLRPDSPALKLGFQPIPFEKIGPYEDKLRASWPIVEAPGVSGKVSPITRYVDLPEYSLEPAQEFVMREGAGNFFSKVSAGQPVKVAYFGGGIHRADGWRASILQELQKRYPKSQISEIPASICDCVRGSGFSVYRYEREVLAHKPDLVLVDFASDDHQTEPRAIWRAIEAVVRQTWKADPHTDICFLYAFREGFEENYNEGTSPVTVSAYEKLAKHYGIPAINMGCRIAELAKQGKLVIKAPSAPTEEEVKALEGKAIFSNDGVRPSADGDKIYTEVIAQAFERLGKEAKPTEHVLKKPLEPDNYERAKQVPIDPSMLTGDWQMLPPDDPLSKRFARHFPTIWFTNTPGSKLTFKFKGTSASLFNLIGPDTGQAIIAVDGKGYGLKRQIDRWCTSQRLSGLAIADGLEDKVHTVTIELHPDPPDRTSVIEVAKEKPGFHKEDFEGVAFRFGWIRIVGEMAK